MVSRLPPLHTLQAFEAVSRLRSFTLAARELHLTHSAISHQMRALEESLGTTMFDRSRRAIALTPAGQRFRDVVRPLLEELAAVTDAIRQPSAGRLSVSVLPSFAGRWLLPRLGRFLAQHPGLDVDVSATQSIVSLDRAGVNLGIRCGGGAWPGVTSELLGEETLFPVASPAYLKAHGVFDSGDLSKATLLRDSYLPWDDVLRALDVDQRACRFGAVYHDSALTFQAAEAGQGVALGRSWLVADALRNGTLARVGTVNVRAPSAYYLVYPRGRPVAQAVHDFRVWILAEANGDAIGQMRV